MSVEACILCGDTNYTVGGHGPKVLITCECCLDNFVHIGCWQQKTGILLTAEQVHSSDFKWFCTQASDAAGGRIGQGAVNAGLPYSPRSTHLPPPCMRPRRPASASAGPWRLYKADSVALR